MESFTKPISRQAMTNEQLMLAFQSGDQQSMGQLFRNLQPSLVSFATSKVPLGRPCKKQVAQDAVQNAFTKVIAKVGNDSQWKPGQAKVDSWMRLIVYQKVIELMRKKSGNEKTCTDFDTADQPCYSVEQLKELPSRLTHDFDSIVEQVTKLLPSDLKLVVQMILAGLSRREISERLGISEPTVCRRSYAAQRFFEDFDFGLTV